MVQTQQKSRKKGVLAILSVALIFVSSLAFFTDYKKNSVDAAFGTLGITAVLEEVDLSNLAPGDSNEMDLVLTNTGSLDGKVRHTYVITSTSDFGANDIKLTNSNGDVVTVINEKVIGSEFALTAGEVKTDVLGLVVAGALGNDYQLSTFQVEILTEITQSRNNETPVWTELATETITFGGSDLLVVPGA